jgi:hypothetical protein
VFDQVYKKGIGEFAFITPFCIAKYITEQVRISAFDPTHSFGDLATNVCSCFPDIIPVATFREGKTVKLGKFCVIFITVRISQRLAIFSIVYIRYALKEEQWKDVDFEVAGIYRALKNPGGFGEVLF